MYKATKGGGHVTVNKSTLFIVDFFFFNKIQGMHVCTRETRGTDIVSTWVYGQAFFKDLGSDLQSEYKRFFLRLSVEGNKKSNQMRNGSRWMTN